MPRTKGEGNPELKKKIREVLSGGKRMYLSELARAIDKSNSTVYLYLTTFMKDDVEMVSTVGGEKGNLVTYYRLKK